MDIHEQEHNKPKQVAELTKCRNRIAKAMQPGNPITTRGDKIQGHNPSSAPNHQ
jgi:hypothetical protein